MNKNLQQFANLSLIAGRAPASFKRPQRSAQSGLTLIEVLITVIITSVGLLGLAALQATGLQQNHSAYLRTQATNLSYQILDELRSNRSVVIPAGDLVDREFWDDRVAALLPGGRIETLNFAQMDDGPLQRVTLVLEWVDERVDAEEEGGEEGEEGEGEGGGEIQFRTETVI